MVFLISIRLGAIFAMAPVFGSVKVPIRFRVLLVFALSTTLAIALGVKHVGLPTTAGGIILAAASELVVGALLAFGLFTAFGAFVLGGRIVDIQIGFGVANIYDPITRSQVPLLGSMLELVALMVFFSLDGHHMIIRGLAFSLEKLPPGMILSELDPGVIVAQFGAMFTYALVIVAPVMFSLLLLDVGLAVISRTMPQINIFFVSAPLKVFVGLSVLALSVRYMGDAMRHIFELIFIYWQRLLA